MMHYHICKTRIRKLHLPKGYDAAYVQIGVPDVKGEALKVGLNKVGDIVLPSPKLGVLCNRNANGYSYTDNTNQRKGDMLQQIGYSLLEMNMRLRLRVTFIKIAIQLLKYLRRELNLLYLKTRNLIDLSSHY